MSKFGCWINGYFIGILGYSDDNFLIAPSIHALQEMFLICESYAASHDLKFSTDSDPRKCKTKCIAFLKNRRETDLPWVASGKHLGFNLDDKMNGMKNDMRIKRDQYITKNNDLCQEYCAKCHFLCGYV